jgi:lipopolysaccharide/colanic/teichoic acid biosynthesis glycosyltransferase
MVIKDKLGLAYILTDALATMLAWLIFFYYRKLVVIPEASFYSIWSDGNLYLGLIFIPLAWFLWFLLLAAYGHIDQRSRVETIYQTVLSVLIGSLFILFILLSDDDTLSYVSYLRTFIVLVLLNIGLLLIFRISWLTLVSVWLKKGDLWRNTLVLGHTEIDYHPYISSYHRIVLIQTIGELKNASTHLESIEEVLLLPESSTDIKALINCSYKFAPKVVFKLPSDLALEIEDRSNLAFCNEVNNLLIITDSMPFWQQNVKRCLDVFLSIGALIVLIPLIIFTMYKVRKSSIGPIFFRQDRVGLRGKQFGIIKFRSMYAGAESEGPRLSYDGDERCTPWGKIMRKYRIDEIPQFWNVIKGEMSLVGPRPERKYYIDQLLEVSDQLMRLYAVKPGITSWGQVKYGYASDLSQMFKRLRYDLLYLDNRNLFLDFKIMFYTSVVLIKGKGR